MKIVRLKGEIQMCWTKGTMLCAKIMLWDRLTLPKCFVLVAHYSDSGD